MGDLSLVELTTDSKDGAAKALDATKRLEHEGWLEVIDYAVVSRDEKGNVSVRDTDNDVPEKAATAAVGVYGGVIGGVIGGPVGAAVGVAAGLLTGAAAMRLKDLSAPDSALGEVPANLPVNSSLLAVVVEPRYADKLEEELHKLGKTARRDLQRAERDAEFDAYLLRAKAKLRSLQDDVQAQLAKAQTATQSEKARLEADIAAKRAQLEADQDKLADQIKAANAELAAEVREMNFRLELAGLSTRAGISANIDHLQRQLNRFNDELEDLIQARIASLKAQDADLKAKAASASGDTKAALQNHLVAVEARLGQQRAELRRSFQDRLLGLQQWLATLHVRAALAQASVREKLQAQLAAAQQSLANSKAKLLARHEDDEQAGKDIREGFNKAWKDLQDAFDQASRERVQ